MFSSLAARAAQAKGLHQQYSKDCSLSPEHIEERSKVFWSVYALEKTVTFRLGRPSVSPQHRRVSGCSWRFLDTDRSSKTINDEDISCPFPHQCLNEKSGFFDDTLNTFVHMTRLARISSKIQQRLYSSAALNLPAESLITVRDALEGDLSVWRDSLPDISNPLKPLRAFGTGPLVHSNQALFIRFSYFDAVGALHRRFAAPYLFSEDCEIRSKFTAAEPWRRSSVQKNVESARQMILLIRHIEVESYTPSW
jgi:hypothetical protein